MFASHDGDEPKNVKGAFKSLAKTLCIKVMKDEME